MAETDDKASSYPQAGLRQAPAEAEAAFLAMVRALRAIRAADDSVARKQLNRERLERATPPPPAA